MFGFLFKYSKELNAAMKQDGSCELFLCLLVYY